jgi:DNA-binding response OmpR family regulator
MAKILVIEDDSDLSQVLRIALSAKGHSVQVCLNGERARDLLRMYQYDLIILDWMMPVVTGIDVLNDFRSSGGTTPVLMLTARCSSEDKEKGLDSGADDYLTKPFDSRELLARVRALLRRPHSLSGVTLKAGDLELDPIACSVKKRGEEIHLRPKVYSLLEFFMRHPNQVFSADALLQRVWLDEDDVSLDSVRTHIKLMRQSVDAEAALIKTVRNKGYKLAT